MIFSKKKKSNPLSHKPVVQFYPPKANGLPVDKSSKVSISPVITHVSFLKLYNAPKKIHHPCNTLK